MSVMKSIIIEFRYAYICGMFFLEQIVLLIQINNVVDSDQKMNVLINALVSSVIGIASIIIILFLVFVSKVWTAFNVDNNVISLRARKENNLFFFAYITCVVGFLLNLFGHVFFALRGERFPLFYFMIPGMTFYISFLMYKKE
jgi:hypothetical protein